MSARRQLLRAGAYLDSVVLLELQRRLAAEPGVLRAAAVMATPANQELLATSGLVGEEGSGGRPDDLIVVVEAEDDGAAATALARVDELLSARRTGGGQAARPRSLDSAFRQLPTARWVLISVPGPYAAEVAWRALGAGRHVFLFSDHVPLAEEVALKRAARQRGLLVLGPDCGTAVVAGTGLGFANRVRPGPVGLVAASGTGLQAVCSELDALGVGVSQALGTGGRDLSAAVGGIAARQGLDLLAGDPATRVVVLISKPPAPAVAGRLLAAARRLGKPVVAWLLGTPLPARRLGDLWFAATPADAAELAAELVWREQERAAAGAATLAGQTPGGPGAAGDDGDTESLPAMTAGAPLGEPGAAAAERARYVRALCGGGTLATQLVAGLQLLCEPLYSNVALRPEQQLDDPSTSRAHCVVDLGADELTAGRPHPMLDPQPLADRLTLEAADPEVGLLIFDVVLGDGAAADPAATLAPAVAAARRRAADEGRPLVVAALLVGTRSDPQDLESQASRLGEAGATVCRSIEEALALAWDHVASRLAEEPAAAVAPDALAPPLAAVTVGVEAFHQSLLAQGAAAVQVEWRPPAGGDAALMDLLRRMR
ncbi:MAG TPA: acyl-CoA synthetase FdrA [Thermoanaerobaculia bacterium]|jgi:FdrA protein|nr:acyl-CoA synthetase FdrA [Thermoanaerobaculia bacterium]